MLLISSPCRNYPHALVVPKCPTVPADGDTLEVYELGSSKRGLSPIRQNLT